jgi:hypothetical protein
MESHLTDTRSTDDLDAPSLTLGRFSKPLRSALSATASPCSPGRGKCRKRTVQFRLTTCTMHPPPDGHGRGHRVPGGPFRVSEPA